MKSESFYCMMIDFWIIISVFIITSDSNLELSVFDVNSEPLILSQSKSKEKSTWSNIWQYCRTLDEGENHDNKEWLLYAYNACDFHMIATSNFHLHYAKVHNITIKSDGGKIHCIKWAEEKLQNIITQV